MFIILLWILQYQFLTVQIVGINGFSRQQLIRIKGMKVRSLNTPGNISFKHACRDSLGNYPTRYKGEVKKSLKNINQKNHYVQPNNQEKLLLRKPNTVPFNNQSIEKYSSSPAQPEYQGRIALKDQRRSYLSIKQNVTTTHGEKKSLKDKNPNTTPAYGTTEYKESTRKKSYDEDSSTVKQEEKERITQRNNLNENYKPLHMNYKKPQVYNDQEGYYNTFMKHREISALKNYNKNNYSTPHVKAILAFGDSLTEGLYNNKEGRHFLPYSTSLEYLLNKHTKDVRYHVINDGVSGECVYTEMATRLPFSLNEYKKNLKLVIILGGTNDLRKLDCKGSVNLAYEIINLHNIAHRAGYKTVVVTIPEADESKTLNLPYSYETYLKLWKKTNKKLRHYARVNKNSTVLFDLAKEFPMHGLNEQEKKRYWAEQLHPTGEGYRVIAKKLFKVLRHIKL